MQASLERALQDKDMQTGSPNELGQQVREIAPDVILMDKHISIGLFTFQPNSMILEGNGLITRLSAYQTKLLTLLYVCMNMTVTREEICRMLWPDVIVIDQSINNLICQLRKILKADPNIRIENIRGVGYQLCLE